MFDNFLTISLIKRAVDNGIVSINIVNLRDHTHDNHRTVDDRPYGGGPGMVMKPEPLFAAVDSVRSTHSHVILLTPQGRRFDQRLARELADFEHIIMICGHYEGVDERVRTGLANAEISIGDYILTSGNLPAMVVADATIRLLPGVLGCKDSVVEESFTHGYLEYPQYTRPEVFRGMRVPEVLLQGNHQRIHEWRRQQSWERTRNRRPDLPD